MRISYKKLIRQAESEGMDVLDLLNEATQDLVGTANIAAINKFFRITDTSHKYPVSGRFNVTERAIRKVRQSRSDGCGPDDGLPYILALNEEISRCVNAY